MIEPSYGERTIEGRAGERSPAAAGQPSCQRRYWRLCRPLPTRSSTGQDRCRSPIGAAPATRPENTLPAFQDALDLGYRYLETDVRVTADGVIVAFHDDDLMRTCSRPGKISELPWSEVRTAMVEARRRSRRWRSCSTRSRRPGSTSTARPTTASTPLVAARQADRARLDRVCLASFSDRRLKRLRAALGPTCARHSARSRLALLRYGLTAPPSRAGRPGARASRARSRWSTASSSSGPTGSASQVHVWTIDDPAEMDRLLDLGVDGIMTDKPTVLKEVARRPRRLALTRHAATVTRHRAGEHHRAPPHRGERGAALDVRRVRGASTPGHRQPDAAGVGHRHERRDDATSAAANHAVTAASTASNGTSGHRRDGRADRAGRGEAEAVDDGEQLEAADAGAAPCAPTASPTRR